MLGLDVSCLPYLGKGRRESSHGAVNLLSRDHERRLEANHVAVNPAYTNKHSLL